MEKLQMGGGFEYIPPKMIFMSFVCEAGFAVSNDDLTEQYWGWDE